MPVSPCNHSLPITSTQRIWLWNGKAWFLLYGGLCLFTIWYQIHPWVLRGKDQLSWITCSCRCASCFLFAKATAEKIKVTSLPPHFTKLSNVQVKSELIMDSLDCRPVAVLVVHSARVGGYLWEKPCVTANCELLFKSLEASGFSIGQIM